MNGDNGIVAEVSEHASSVVALGGAMQQVRTAHTTAVAVQRPRSLSKACLRLDEEAALSGERFFYGWGAGKEKIEGPSIKLANAAARCWGNCAVEMLPVQDLPDSWVFTAVFVDLETGFTLPRQFRQSKTSIVYGKHDEARKMDIRFQIGQSKAMRNVIINALPAGLIDSAMDAAKSGVRQKIERFIAGVDKSEGAGKGIVKAIDAVMGGLAKHGVTEARVFAKLEISARSAVTVDRIITLRGDLAALDDGEARPGELYPAVVPEGGVSGIKSGKAGEPAADPLAGLPSRINAAGGGIGAAKLHPIDQAIADMEDAATFDRLKSVYDAALKNKEIAKSDHKQLEAAFEQHTERLNAPE